MDFVHFIQFYVFPFPIKCDYFVFACFVFHMLFETTMFLYDRTSILLNKCMFTHILSILRKVTLDQHSMMYWAGQVLIPSVFYTHAAQLTNALAPQLSDWEKNSAFLSL